MLPIVHRSNGFFWKYLADPAGGHAVEKMGAAEVEKHRITVQQRERHFLGSPATEIIIFEAAVIMAALALILADQGV